MELSRRSAHRVALIRRSCSSSLLAVEPDSHTQILSLSFSHTHLTQAFLCLQATKNGYFRSFGDDRKLQLAVATECHTNQSSTGRLPAINDLIARDSRDNHSGLGPIIIIITDLSRFFYVHWFMQ